MTLIAQALTAALFHFIWQGFAVMLMLWIALSLLKKRSAESRYAVSCVALALLMLLPAITAYISYAPAGSHVRAASTQPATKGVAATTANSAAIASSWIAELQILAFPIWLFGVALLSLRLLWGSRRISLLRRAGSPADDSVLSIAAKLAGRMRVSRRVRLLISADAGGPGVAGWLRPIILMPSASILGLSAEQLEAVLAHEIAHIRRYDDIVNALQMSVETMLFYHPAVWWTSAKIRHERELCCDDLAVRTTGDRLCYARALVKLERLRLTTPSMVLGVADGPLSYRIRRIVGQPAPEYPLMKAPGIFTLSLCLGLFLMAMDVTHVHGQAQTTTDPVIVYATATKAPLTLQTGSTADGPGVTVDLGGSNVIHRTPIYYPEAALKQGVAGTVVIEASLDSTGNVSDARVLSGPPELRKAALMSVLQWHFTSDTANSFRQVSARFDAAAAAAKTAAQTTTNVMVNADSRRKIELEAALTEDMARRTDDSAVGTEEKMKRDQEAVEQRRETLLAKQFLTQELDAMRAQTPAEGADSSKAAVMKMLELRLAEAQDAKGDVNAAIPMSAKAAAEKDATLKNKLYYFGVATNAVGRTLKSITFSEVSDASQSDILSRLPVRVGDTLTQASLESVVTAVRSYDEHLIVSFEASADNGATLRISVRR